MKHQSGFVSKLTMLCFGLALVPFLLSSQGFLVPVWAAPSLKVGMIDPHAVIKNSRAGKRALAALENHYAVRQKLLGNDGEAIRAEQGELKALEASLQDAGKLSEADTQAKQETFRKRFREYQKKVQEYQRRGQEFQQEMGEKQKEMVMEYMKKVETATKAVAEKHGFSMIIDKGSDATLPIVLYSRKGLDLTSEVIKEFDRRFKIGKTE